MWTSALHGFTNFVLGDPREEAEQRAHMQAAADAAVLPPVTNQAQFDALTLQQQEIYIYRMQQHRAQIIQQQQQAQQQQAQQQQQQQQLQPTEPLPQSAPAAALESVSLHDDGAVERIAPSFESAAAESSAPTTQTLAATEPDASAVAAGPSGDEQSGTSLLSADGAVDAPALSSAPVSSPSGAVAPEVSGPRGLFARFLPTLPFTRAAADGAASLLAADAVDGSPAAPSTASVAVASARGALSAAAGSVGHAFSSLKTHIPQFSVSQSAGSSESDELPTLIHQLHQEEARTAHVSKEYKSIIAELQARIAGLECELSTLAKELKARDIESFELKQQCKQEQRAADTLRTQLAAANLAQQEMQHTIDARDAQLAILTSKLAQADRSATATTAAPVASVSAAPSTVTSAYTPAPAFKSATSTATSASPAPAATVPAAAAATPLRAAAASTATPAAAAVPAGSSVSAARSLFSSSLSARPAFATLSGASAAAPPAASVAAAATPAAPASVAGASVPATATATASPARPLTSTTSFLRTQPAAGVTAATGVRPAGVGAAAPATATPAAHAAAASPYRKFNPPATFVTRASAAGVTAPSANVAAAPAAAPTPAPAVPVVAPSPAPAVTPAVGVAPEVAPVESAPPADVVAQ